jgi:hypothetical protein
MTGIHLKGDKAVAADGFYLLEATLPTVDAADFPNVGVPADLPPQGVTLPADALAATLKAIPKGKPVATMPILGHALLADAGDGGVELVATDLAATSRTRRQPIDGAFPDTDQIFPTAEPVFSIRMDAKRLATLLTAMVEAGAGDGDLPVVRLDVFGTNQAMRLNAKAGDGRLTRGLLMPVVAGGADERDVE